MGTKSKTTNINSFTIDGNEIRDPRSKDKLYQYFCNTVKQVQEEAFTLLMCTLSYLTKLSKLIELSRLNELHPTT